MRSIRNTVGVVVTTILTIAVLYAVVQLTMQGEDPTSVADAVALPTQSYMCQVSGCSAQTCHSAIEVDMPPVTVTTQHSNTCPATGCRASTCHGEADPTTVHYEIQRTWYGIRKWRPGMGGQVLK